MIEVLSTIPIRVQSFEFTQSMDCVGTKVSFHSPEILPISSPLKVSIDGKTIFDGKVEAKVTSFSVSANENQYGGRDLLTIRLDTCLHPKSFAKGMSVSQLLSDLCPDLPFEVRGKLPALPPFSVDPGEKLLETLQSAGKKIGASVFVSHGKVVFAKELRQTTVSFGPQSAILSLELEENVSQIFDELLFLEDKKEVAGEQKKVRRVRILALEAKMRKKEEKKDDLKAKIKQKSYEAIRDSFSCRISCSELLPLEPYDLVSVNLPHFSISGSFAVSDIRYSLSKEEERMIVTLKKPEGFSLS